MGNSYYKPITTWSKGEYVNATQKQDDLAIIRTYIPMIPADAGSSAATATPLVAVPTEPSNPASNVTVQPVHAILDGNSDW
jgi:hypothetical protein